jgi:hypothetical protein
MPVQDPHDPGYMGHPRGKYYGFLPEIDIIEVVRQG